MGISTDDTYITKIYKNSGNDLFQEQVSHKLLGLRDG